MTNEGMQRVIAILEAMEDGAYIISPIKARKRQEGVWNYKCQTYQDWASRNDRCKPTQDPEVAGRDQE